MSTSNEYCVPLPAPKPISILLPFGVTLSSITDASKPPTDCAVVHSLMLQMTPLLAGMTCMLRVLAVVNALPDAVTGKVGALTQAMSDMSDCLGLVLPTNILKMVSGILCLLISYLGCAIDSFESILMVQAGIDLDSVQGNPVLLGNLTCAQTNAQNAANGVMSSMAGAQPLLDIVNILMKIAGQSAIDFPPLVTKSPSELLNGEDPLEPVRTLREALIQVNSAFPPLVRAC